LFVLSAGNLVVYRNYKDSAGGTSKIAIWSSRTARTSGGAYFFDLQPKNRTIEMAVFPGKSIGTLKNRSSTPPERLDPLSPPLWSHDVNYPDAWKKKFFMELRDDENDDPGGCNLAIFSGANPDNNLGLVRRMRLRRRETRAARETQKKEL
jgi:hypothetical protein